MIATSSAICSISGRMCDETKTVLPLADEPWRSARMSTIPAGSNPLAGSSSRSSGGSLRSAAAMPSRCFMPSEYVS